MRKRTIPERRRRAIARAGEALGEVIELGEGENDPVGFWAFCTIAHMAVLHMQLPYLMAARPERTRRAIAKHSPRKTREERTKR